MTLLETHEVDAWFHVDTTRVAELQRVPGYRIIDTPANAFEDLEFNVRDRILSDVRVRRAIASAIDRRRIAADATNNLFLPTDSDQASFSWAADHHATFFPYDPTKAARLLNEDGWRVGLDGVRVRGDQRLSLQLAYISGQGLGRRVAALVQQQLKAVGIEIGLREVPASEWFASAQDGGILAGGKYQIAYSSWLMGVDPDDSYMYRCDQVPPRGLNTLFWCDHVLDAAEEDALTHMDQARRKRDYKTVATEIGEQVPTVYLFAGSRIDIVPRGFSGFRPSPALSANWNAYQWSIR